MKAKLKRYITSQRRLIAYARYCTDVKAELDSAIPRLSPPRTKKGDRSFPDCACKPSSDDALYLWLLLLSRINGDAPPATEV